MPHPATWLLAAAPATLALIGAVAVRRGGAPGGIGRAGLAAALVAFAGGVAGAAALALGAGPQHVALAWHGIGIGIALDALSVTMLLLVAFVGSVVLAYSRTFLEGDPGHRRFLGWLCLTLAAVLVLMLSENLAQLLLAWIATSLFLHKLLTFYGERPAARLAAAKKFIVSRLGDACLLAAAALAYMQFDTLDIAEIGARAGAAPSTALALLLVSAALLKSAQMPFHGWLPEVMETPTPVSALLHAGIINAGGFLALRLAFAVQPSTEALHALALVGGFTALAASLAMLTQTSVKVALAWSTLAQMGFMLLQCGLGAFSAALLHIVAHALYKAHAFLSAGDALRQAPAHAIAARPGAAAAALAGAAALTLGIGALAGVQPGPGAVVLGAVLAMGLAQVLLRLALPPSLPSLAAGAAAVALLAAISTLLQAGAEALFADALPAAHPAMGPWGWAVAGLVLIGSGAVAMLQMRPMPRAWAGLHAHFHNGFYLNALADRAMARLFPSLATPAIREA